MRSTILAIVGVLIVIGAFFAAKQIVANKKKPKPTIEKVVKTVTIQTVLNTTVPITIPANGTLTATNRLELYAENQGVFQYSSHDFKPGQAYTKGQTLLRLNAAEFYASIQAAKSDYINLVTSIMPDLRLDYQDAFPVWEQYLNSLDASKSIPSMPVMTSEKVNYFITGRGLQGSYYNIKNLEQRLSKFSITAPFTGVLTEALVTKGTLIRPGQKLGEFIDASSFEVELAIAKEYSDLLKQGESVSLKSIDAEVFYSGKVTRINGRIDQATQTVKVFVDVKGADLKEGMYLEAQLSARKEENAIKVARKLLVNESQLFIVRDSVLDIIEVTPVYFSAKEVVLKGVPNGTEIVTRNIPGAYAGMLVKISEANIEVKKEASLDQKATPKKTAQ